AGPGPGLPARLAALAPEAGGVVGVGVLHVESGRRAALRAGERFPMASVYKVPIALAFLHRVDGGQAALEEEVSYGAADLPPVLEHSAIVERARGGSARATARELLEAALVERDNTATDLVLPLSRRPAAGIPRR